MAGTEEVLLLLGGDLGDPPATLNRAEAMLAGRAGQVLARSRDHWTEPWGFDGQGLFLNRALLLRTALAPERLLGAALGIERELGRTRVPGGGYSSRTIDIDILFFGDRVVGTPELAIPHPRMHERAFALAPACDIAPGKRHPVSGRTLLELLHDLRGNG